MKSTPVTVNDLLKFERQSVKYIKVKSNGGYFQLLLSDILYIECDSFVLDFHLTDGSVCTCVSTLKSMENKLEECFFVRINRNILVNELYIKKVIKNPSTGGGEMYLRYSNKMFVVSRRRRLDICKRH